MIEQLKEMDLDEVVDEIIKDKEVTFLLDKGEKGSVFLCHTMHGKVINFFDSNVFLFGGIENCTQMIVLSDDDKENREAIKDLLYDFFSEADLKTVHVLKVGDVGKLI